MQGAPGTGKTAVGLHRAAYLLYAHRERLRRAGVLVVGPNRAFLSYIAAVLPALGEVDVEQTTVDELLAPGAGPGGRRAGGRRAQGRRADGRGAAPGGVGAIGTPPSRSRCRTARAAGGSALEPLRRIVDETRREGLPYGTGRERVRARVVEPAATAGRGAPGERPARPGCAGWAGAGRCPTFLDAVWPALTPVGLVLGLLVRPGRLAAAADGLLTDDEQAHAGWPKPARTPKAPAGPPPTRC